MGMVINADKWMDLQAKLFIGGSGDRLRGGEI